jgi:nucleoside-diphosphate-sugar epimerase
MLELKDAPRATPVVAVTGANGYVGSLATAGFRQAGFSVRRLVRGGGTGRDDFAYTLDREVPGAALEGVDTLVHCAYDFTVTQRRQVWATNVLGTQRLIAAAGSAGVRRSVFISSMSAYPGTRQLYGLAKLAGEAMALSYGMCVVRLGLVYGPNSGGMAGALRRLASLPLIPLPGSRCCQYMLHEDDLAHALPVLARADPPDRAVGLAHPVPVPISRLLRRQETGRTGRLPVIVPVPWRPVYWAMRAAELTPVHLPLRADSLLGLVRPAPRVPLTEHLRTLGLELRPFQSC